MRRRRRCASRLRAPLRCGPSRLDAQARCVIVLGGSRLPNIADSFSITTCCALRCLPDAHKLTSGTLVVAELSLKPNAAVVRQIAGHDDTDMKILPTNGASAGDPLLGSAIPSSAPPSPPLIILGSSAPGRPLRPLL